MTDICVQPHDPDRRALPSLRLCGGCHHRLERDLAALPRLHAQLGVALAGGSSPRTGGRVSGSSSEPLPINPAAADLRDQIRHDLVWWCRYVAEHRGIGLSDDRLTEVGAWLARHVDWIAAQPEAAEECPPVMAGLAGRAKAILEPSGAKRITIGPCKETIEDEPCGGTLYATVRREDDPRPSVIYCGECSAEYPPETWRRFGRDYLKEAG